MTAFEERPHSPYYGARRLDDAVPDPARGVRALDGRPTLARELEREARAAIAWIDSTATATGDGYVEYERRNTETGLDNQCWKDSWDSIAFADGTLAPTPRATCELQGYVYDAKRRTARLAREVWNDPDWAARLEREAEELKRRFNRGLLDRRARLLRARAGRQEAPGRLADVQHRPPAVERHRRRRQGRALCVRHLMSDDLFSGWGVRTMAASEGSYNPIGYHVGTVWPHDNSFIAWGLRRYGYRAEAARICRGDARSGGPVQRPPARGVRRLRARAIRASRSSTPPRAARRRGRPARRCCSCARCSGLDSDGKHLIVDPAHARAAGALELLDIPGRWGHMDAFGRGRKMTQDH